MGVGEGDFMNWDKLFSLSAIPGIGESLCLLTFMNV